MQNQKQAYFYAILAVLFWATVASAFKITLRYLNYIELLLYSSFASLVVLFIILLIQKKVNLLSTCTRKDFSKSALLGFLNPFLYYLVLFKAYSLLTAQEAVTLNYVWPIILALLSIPLLKQKIGILSIAAIVISFVGVFIIATGGDILSFRFTNLTGALLALGSAVIWSLYWIFNIKDDQDQIVRLFLNFAFGFVYILIIVLVMGWLKSPSLNGILGAAYVGMFEMGVTFAVWLRALKLSRTTAQVSNLVYAAPFLSLGVISFVLGEKILASTMVGLVFIVTGILVQRYFSSRIN